MTDILPRRGDRYLVQYDALISAAFAFVLAELSDPSGPDRDGAWDDLCVVLADIDRERYEAMLDAIS